MSLEKSVGYHDIARASSGEPKLMSDVGGLVASSDLLVRIHGALMLASWIGTASVGMLLARYYRQTWVSSQLCGKDHWFAVRLIFLLPATPRPLHFPAKTSIFPAPITLRP
jgi:hypothetical protein